jgi:adenylate cyclase
MRTSECAIVDSDRKSIMVETRKIAAILVADIVGYSRLAGADEDRTLSRLRGLRSDLIDPAINAHDGRIVKWTGDGAIVEFRSVVQAVRCALEVQNGMAERNVGLPPERRIDFRIGVHFGDVAEEADGDLMGDGVNVAARLEGVGEPGGVCLSEQAYWLVKGRSDIPARDLGPIKLKNIADPVRVFSLQVGLPPPMRPVAKPSPPARSRRPALRLAGVAVAAVLAMAPDWRPWSIQKPDGLSAALYDKLATAPRLSIVVLPFESLASDPDQENFADAFTDDLTADVSQLKDSFVIGRDSASSYKEKPVDPREIGDGLGVRYLLEGSTSRIAGTVRVSAQLIATETGARVWVDRFEGAAAQVGQMQKDFVARLAHLLGAEIVKTDGPPTEIVKTESLPTMRKRPPALPAIDRDERANRRAPAPQRQRLAALPPPSQARPPEQQPAFCGSPVACWRSGSVYHPVVLDYAPAPQAQRQAAALPPPQARPSEPQPASCGSPLACWRSGGVNY